MKTVVSLQDLAEQEIHPAPLLEQFRARLETALPALWAGAAASPACPACAKTDAEPAFEKLGVAWVRCRRCASVYAASRPDDAALAEWERTSAPAVFWKTDVLAATAVARRDKLTRPRAEWVADTAAEHAPGPVRVLDLSPADDAFHGELRATLPSGSTVTAGDARRRDWTGTYDLVTAFDTIDRVADVRRLVEAVSQGLRPGGLWCLTAPSMSGFDLQVLEARAGAILPPMKINLLSIDGFGHLFGPPAWRVLELSTPGMFDVENVRRAVLADPGADWPRVVRQLVLQGDEARREFQEYLQRHRLASFARLVVRRT